MTTTLDAEVGRVPNDAEVVWRIERLSKLGATDQLAAEAAATTVDLHTVERLKTAGCPLELAREILRPFPWEPGGVDRPIAVTAGKPAAATRRKPHAKAGVS